MKKGIAISTLLLISSAATSNELYREPSSGDKGTYYVIERQPLSDGNIRVLSSRIGKGSAYTDFTELKVNCDRMQYFELGGSSEDGAKQKPSKPLKDWSNRSKWTSLVTGSSKSDLVHFICRKY
ncbi:hypothetical protein ACJJJB_19920 [Microbulbifer sp. ANSA001]|uniref:hypothetical protein n=1 Tax=Microbulbifer sp. ANSA001 TaxID=3243358 RepID=UPI0040410EEC